jgi:haloacid dehalogenase superfamily, subfamily IA, variant 3 with third motif having DD or ED/haloacid dehalogenase superfamily, subfamily IA, variant 1 with third motif having Dx(3-4)D or Dx(3-4)E
MLKAVTLDFWDTLVVSDGGPEHDRRQIQRLFEELGALGEPRSEAAIRDALLAAYNWFDGVWCTEHRTPGALQTLEFAFATLGVNPPAVVVARVVEFFEQLALDLAPAVVPGVSAVLPRLATRYKLAIICDTGYAPGAVLRELLLRNELLHLFSTTYFSNERGTSKPDARAFRCVCDELGVRPGEAVHVGDSQRTDIAGAQAAGMLAVHFVGANDRDAVVSTADALIRSFEELPIALDTLIRAADSRPVGRP